jgi:hypothetical protein
MWTSERYFIGARWALRTGAGAGAGAGAGGVRGRAGVGSDT